jgi:hypothetical protein
VLDTIEDAGMLTCSGSDSITSVDDTDGLYFRTAPPSRLEGMALAELVLADRELRASRRKHSVRCPRMPTRSWCLASTPTALRSCVSS